jgi:hypothetical protein
MSESLTLQHMRADVENLPLAGNVLRDRWFADTSPSQTPWRSPLSTDPVDVIDVMLTHECNPHLAHLWWCKYGFLLRETEPIRMIAERAADLESIIGSALLGILWRSASGQLTTGQSRPNDEDTATDMRRTRTCSQQLWRRLWQNPQLAVRTPDLRAFVAAYPSTIAFLGIDDPGEAYLVQNGLISAQECGAHLQRVLRDTFSAHPNTLQLIEMQGLDPVEAWTSLFDQIEQQESTAAALPALSNDE